MKRRIVYISLVGVFLFFTSCSNAPETQTPGIVSAETVVAMFNATVAAAPTVTATVIPTIPATNAAQIEATATIPAATNTAVKVLVPLYWEATWENWGRKEIEVIVNETTNERITLSGYSYQAPLSTESLINNSRAYYSIENMENIGWKFMSGAGGAGVILIEYYNENGYFLMVWDRSSQQESPSITVWISDETTVIPVIPTPQ